MKDKIFKQILYTLFKSVKKYTKLTDENFFNLLNLAKSRSNNEQQIITDLLYAYNIHCLKKEYYEVNAVIQQQEVILKNRIEELNNLKES